jgi:hypothetical protein
MALPAAKAMLAGAEYTPAMFDTNFRSVLADSGSVSLPAMNAPADSGTEIAC